MYGFVMHVAYVFVVTSDPLPSPRIAAMLIIHQLVIYEYTLWSHNLKHELNIAKYNIVLSSVLINLVTLIFVKLADSADCCLWDTILHQILDVWTKNQLISRLAEFMWELKKCNKKHLKNFGPIRQCEPPHATCSNFTLPFTRCRYCRHHYQDEPKPAI